MQEITRQQVQSKWTQACIEFPFVMHEAWILYEQGDGLVAVDQAGADVLIWEPTDGQGWTRAKES